MRKFPTKWRGFLWLVGALGAATWGAESAGASAVLKATKGSSRNLQPRAIDIETQIDGAWAQTTVKTVYANANSENIEADFIYSAPPGSVVTGFAYWFGKEKVVAQIEEKERAAAIYQATKAQPKPVDPMLVEMIGKNLFRARINPVAANQDLRVEIKLAQPLSLERGNLVWNYPLAADTRDVTLDWLRARIEVKNGARAQTNYGAALSNGEFLIRKNNYKPQNALRVALPQASAPISASVVAEHIASPDGKADGDAYFALSVRTPRATKGLPTISGVETFEVLAPEKPTPGEIRLFGRYRGKGAATVAWGGAKTVVWFAPSSDESNEIHGLAAKLWGARRLETLSKDLKSRFKVIALSHQFGLPSKWTSWLAMPHEERKKFDEQIRRIDFNRKGTYRARTWVLETENNRPYSPRALEARAALRALTRSSAGRKIGFDELSAREAAIKTRLAELAHLAQTRELGLGAGDAQARAKMARLASISQENPSTYLQSAGHELRLVQVHTVAKRWKAQVVALREAMPEAKRLKTQLETLSERYQVEDDFEAEAYQATAKQIALDVMREALEGREDGPRAARLLDVGERYTRRVGQSNFRTAFYEPTIEANLETVNDQLLGEVEAGRDASPEARQAKTRIKALYALAPQLRSTTWQPGSKEWEIERAVKGRAHETAYRLAQTKRERPNDTAAQAQLQAQLDQIASNTEEDAEDFEKYEDKRIAQGEPLLNARQYQLRPGDPLIAVSAPQDARVVAVLPDGEVRPLAWNAVNGKWETRFDVPAYALDGRYIIQILIARADGSRSRFTMPFTVDTAAPRAHGLAQNSDDARWQLRLWTQSATERVVALLPWRERIELKCHKAGLFGAQAQVPPAYRGQRAQVRFIVTDRAHNRTEVLVDWNR